jgi:hypothetical protein
VGITNNGGSALLSIFSDYYDTANQGTTTQKPTHMHDDASV